MVSHTLKKAFYKLLPSITIILWIIIINAVFGGVILSLISNMPIPISINEHILFLTGIRNPLDYLASPINLSIVQVYAYFDLVTGWLLIPAIFGVFIQYLIDSRRQLKELRDLIESRDKGFASVRDGKCPLCGNKLKWFRCKKEKIEGYICEKCDTGDVSLIKQA